MLTDIAPDPGAWAVERLEDERHRCSRDLSAALTRHSLEHGSGVATLGVYTDNEVAVRLHTRLGYRVAHTFSSGVLAP